MNNQQKKRIFQKLWAWICLSINILVAFLYLARQYANSINRGIILSVLTACSGVLRAQLYKLTDDTSVTSVVIKYVCLFIITFLLGFKTASYLSSFSVLIALAIASFAEILVFFIITYWHAIRHLFVHSKQKNKK